MEEPEELICVGGPCAGMRVVVRPGQKYVQMVRPVRLDFCDVLPDPELMMEAIVYEVLPLAERIPGRAEPDILFVLGYQRRTAPVLRELLNGYERAFGRF